MARRPGTLALPPKDQIDLDRQDLGELIGDPRFIGFLWNLLGASKSGIYQTTYSGSAEATSFREGQRALGLMVLDDCLTARPDTMVLLANEGVRRAQPQTKPQPQETADE